MKTAPMSSSRALTASSSPSSSSCGSNGSFPSASNDNDDAVVVASSEKDGTSIDVAGVGNGISSKRDVLEDNNSESSGMLSGESSNDSSSTDDFDDLSLGDGSGSKGTCSPKSQYKQVEMLAKRETQRIQICRIIVLMVIMITGIIVASGAFVFLVSEEENNYLTGYLSVAVSIENTTTSSIRNMFDSVADLSDYVALSARKQQAVTNTTFPYVTVEYFESRAKRIREQMFFDAIMYMPIVTSNETPEWIQYSASHAGDWIRDSRAVDEHSHSHLVRSSDGANKAAVVVSEAEEEAGGRTGTTPAIPFPNTTTIASSSSLNNNNNDTELYAPIYMVSPPPTDTNFVNEDGLSYKYIRDAYKAVSSATKDRGANKAVLTPHVNYNRMSRAHKSIPGELERHQQFALLNSDYEEAYYQHPHSAIIQPVYSYDEYVDYGDYNNNSTDLPSPKVVGLVHATISWDQFFHNAMPNGVEGIYAVLTSTCGDEFTYLLNGTTVTFLGRHDLHEPDMDGTEYVIPLQPNNALTNASGVLSPAEQGCAYTIHLYSSMVYKSSEASALPIPLTIGVSLIFVVVIVTFVVYDWFVAKRNAKVIKAAARSNGILTSLFPKNVHDRLLKEREEQEAAGKLRRSGSNVAPKAQLNEFLHNDDNAEDDDLLAVRDDNKPIADLFPETTILFADIAGFTAWSSVREPAQVFILLETVYHAFDVIAKHRRIFKVETVGDCYVAVTGLPDPRKDHAVAMARFARDCMHKTNALTKKLEVSLGPDTSDLEMRMGLHSGPVTAGVLRGERSRFQLFGDTMNTASRMESTGTRGKIHISNETANLLIGAGKNSWVVPRDDSVVAKGKGELKTFWLTLGKGKSSTISRSESDVASSNDSSEAGTDDLNSNQSTGDVEDRERALAAEKMSRLVDWNVEVLLKLLKQVVARRNASESCESPDDEFSWGSLDDPDRRTLDEVCEIIHLPTFDAEAAHKQEDANNIELSYKVVDQMYQYVADIAAMYNDNPFHNFEHASHVAMSVNKLLSRIVAPDIDYNDADAGALLHDNTYGITSDPLTQFACVFSALIHDADHQGVSNAQLVKEDTCVAKYYYNRSVAEQNSVDLAWQLLMQEEFADLRNTICTTHEESKRFRSLVVNSVMATDICDKELKTLRNGRWAKAFSDEKLDDNPKDAVNRKATIVIEHLIQASDISHTMQHWHVYRRWNERFFMECLKAYKEGRAEKDPAEFWYQGELGFFDFYIIPLCRKLNDCGVFGVSSDEYLNYAMKNRQEWESKGREVVDGMIEIASQKEWMKTKEEATTKAAENKKIVL